MLKNIAVKAGLNGNGKYGVIRAHSLRKFFITQLTNHGVEDKIINFLVIKLQKWIEFIGLDE